MRDTAARKSSEPGARRYRHRTARLVLPAKICVRIGNGYAAFTKPYPGEMDEWPQRLHGADNNCVAQDTVVGPPRHVQWVSGPAWLRAHIGSPTVTSMVSSGGRLFTIEDAETAENPLLPARWRLVARDAFNGIVLWAKDYPDWEQVTAHMAFFHTQMQRRFVAIGDVVYCTPGLTAPVTALDAATGKVLRTYGGTAERRNSSITKVVSTPWWGTVCITSGTGESGHRPSVKNKSFCRPPDSLLP